MLTPQHSFKYHSCTHTVHRHTLCAPKTYTHIPVYSLPFSVDTQSIHTLCTHSFYSTPFFLKAVHTHLFHLHSLDMLTSCKVRTMCTLSRQPHFLQTMHTHSQLCTPLNCLHLHNHIFCKITFSHRLRTCALCSHTDINITHASSVHFTHAHCLHTEM